MYHIWYNLANVSASFKPPLPPVAYMASRKSVKMHGLNQEWGASVLCVESDPLRSSLSAPEVALIPLQYSKGTICSYI